MKLPGREGGAETARNVDAARERCVHYNGLMNERCLADVVYDEVRRDADNRRGLARFPCWKASNLDTCPRRHFRTGAEAEAYERERAEHVRAFVEKLVGGICPHCDRRVEKKVQVGPCVYAEPCGHRLYQGKADPKMSDEEYERQSWSV